MHLRARLARIAGTGIFVVCCLAILASVARAQDEAALPSAQDSTVTLPGETYANNIAGEFTPSKGFDIIRTSKGNLNISAYGLFRYIDQTPGDQTYTDHLGRVCRVKARNDLYWHRTMVWLSGFLYVPNFRYTITLWSLPTTQQTLLFGNLTYRVSKPLLFGVGIGPNLTARSMQGSWPYWAASDRQMGEEFFRGGFSSAFWIAGEPVSSLTYTASVNTNLSQLGVTATNDTRDLAYSASLCWMPTTGEFGPRGGLADLEEHHEVATRLGTSLCHSREGRYAPNDMAPNATQIRLSDGVYPFEAGALAEGVTVEKLDYDEIAFDAGAKYRGFSLQSEFYLRQLSNFAATAPLDVNEITDRGFMAEISNMVIPKKLNVYAATGYVWDKFERNPWEIAGGMSFFPFGTRLWRLNLHVIRVEKSPTGSNFGYYTAGQSGTTISLGTDILL
jgi:hypothetical protein